MASDGMGHPHDTSQPGIQPAYYGAQPPTVPPKKRRIWPWLLGCGVALFGCIAVTLVALLIIGATASDPGETGGDATDMTYVAPDGDAVIETDEWGLVPGDQLLVLVEEGAGRSAAEEAAAALGGEIIGEFELIGLYQVGVDLADEDALVEAIDAASAVDGVEGAFPDALVVTSATVNGVRCTPTGEDVYAKDGNNRPYDMIGVNRAWDLIAASGLEIQPVRVGILDDGLYDKSGEFDGDVKWTTTGHFEDDYRSDVNYYTDPNDPTKKTAWTEYTHGTAVSSILAANGDDGGITGIASMLGEDLTVEMGNIFRNDYSHLTTMTPDAGDPTLVTDSMATYAIGPLVDMYRQVKNGAKVINNSWGSVYDAQTGKHRAHPLVNAAYKKFYEKMLVEHPDVTFVCAAANDGLAPDGSRFVPGGFDLPNVITVGCLENDGDRASYSNTSSSNFEVTLAAPGHQVPSGIAPDGTVANIDGGTSYATPQVTATIALMRAIDPSLTASDIKEILKQSARAEVDDGAGGKTQIESGLGAGALATDKAIEQVITKKRGGKAVTQAEIDAATGIGLTASSEDGETWTITAKVASVRRGGADIRIVAEEGATVSGDATQRLLQDGSVTWTVTTKQGASPTVHVKRMDTRACWRVKLGSTLAGTYAGTFPVTFVGYGSIEVPYTVTIAPDGTFTGSWHYSGNPGVAGIANYTTDATFGGKLAGTHAEASGTSSAVITGEVGGSMSASDPFTFSADVKQDGSALVGTLVSAGNSIAVNAVRQ